MSVTVTGAFLFCEGHLVSHLFVSQLFTVLPEGGRIIESLHRVPLDILLSCHVILAVFVFKCSHLAVNNVPHLVGSYLW